MRRSLLTGRYLFSSVVLVSFCVAQTQRNAPKSDVGAEIRQALRLAGESRCREAVPILRRAVLESRELSSNDKDLRRQGGLAGVRCAMLGPNPETATEFLRILAREFPRDPEVLYLSVHTYSDLSTRAAQQLATSAPNSSQAHELNAEALEVQGKWEEAQKEYESVLRTSPNEPGLHFRLGRLLLSKPNPPADIAEQARKEFQAELKIDPSNAGAEYVLGELARQGQDWDEAAQHFARATKLDLAFGDAFLGLGESLIAAKKFSEAVSPLEEAVKLEPTNPAAHYNLATAYSRSGRKADADREFTIHRQMTQKEPGQNPALPENAPASPN